MGRDRRRRPLADSTNRSARWLVPGSHSCAGGHHPPAERGFQRWVPRDRRGCGLGRRDWQGSIVPDSMSNQELIRSFESDAVPESSFHHADHVRLAFAYLCEYPVLQALEKFASALKRFAAARGKTQLYNETITCAYFFLIRERIARSECADWA